MDSTTASTGGLTLVLVEGDDAIRRANAVIVRWSAQETAPGEHSLPALAEKVALESRSEYLSWIRDLARTPTARGPLSDALRISSLGRISLWPLTPIAEKAPLNSPAIYPVFKLRALERFYAGRGCHGIEYVGDDPRLHAILRGWCAALQHPYRHVAVARGRTAGKRWRRRLPQWLQALLFMTYLWWTRRRPLPRRLRQTELAGDLVVVTYFPNIDNVRAARGEFYSHYWGRLHELLKEQDIRTDWVWIYTPSGQLDYAATMRLRDDFERAAQGRQRHHLLYEFLTPRVMLKALIGYVELYLKARAILNVPRSAFHLPGSAINLFPLFAEEWNASLFGRFAVNALLFLALFRELARRHRAACVLYVWENLGWEKAMIVASRELSTARTIGCQHFAQAPLDLRSFATDGTDCMPDILAVNGAAAWRELVSTGFPRGRLHTVTALRYLHFRNRRNSQSRVIPRCDRTLLVVGGYLSAETRFQLHLLRAATPVLRRFYKRCVLKPHPFCTLALQDEIAGLPISVEIAGQPLAELWNEADVVYCANSTSAAIEAAWFGLPLIISGAGDGMNLSPLFNWPSVEFATDTPVLTKQLENPVRIEIPADYFCLDDGLDSWRKILQACRQLQ